MPDDHDIYHILGNLEGTVTTGFKNMEARLDSHAETGRVLALKLDAHQNDNEAHGIRAIRQAAGYGISRVNISLVVVMALFAAIELYSHVVDRRADRANFSNTNQRVDAAAQRAERSGR